MPNPGDTPSPAVATPKHLWVVGVLALLWNCMGAFDYVMTESRNASYLRGFTRQQLDYFFGFPAWVIACWAIAVWGGVAGSLLLLLRKRLAVHGLASPERFLLASVAAYIGIDPAKEIEWVLANPLEWSAMLEAGKVDAIAGFPPMNYDLHARKVGHVILNTITDDPWRLYFCCLLAVRRELSSAFGDSVGAQTFSAESKAGVEELRALVAGWLGL